jgi:hypothetical protein
MDSGHRVTCHLPSSIPREGAVQPAQPSPDCFAEQPFEREVSSESEDDYEDDAKRRDLHDLPSRGL